MEKKDLYTMKLTRKEAYMLFLAAGETDIAVLPYPITDVEMELFAMCEARAKNNPQEKEVPLKKVVAPAAKTVAKKK